VEPAINISTVAPHSIIHCKKEVIDDSNGKSSKTPDQGKSKNAHHHHSANCRFIALRKVFVELLRAAYSRQVDRGELDGRLGFVEYQLLQSLDIIEPRIEKGKPLNDWKVSQIVSHDVTNYVNSTYKNVALHLTRCFCRRDLAKVRPSLEFEILTEKVITILSFAEAHRLAQEKFKDQFCDNYASEFLVQEEIVMKESEAEVKIALDELREYDQEDVRIIVSHYFCRILLNKNARTIEKFKHSGLLSELEASEYINQVENSLVLLLECPMRVHPGEKTFESKRHWHASRNFENPVVNNNEIVKQ